MHLTWTGVLPDVCGGEPVCRCSCKSVPAVRRSGWFRHAPHLANKAIATFQSKSSSFQATTYRVHVGPASCFCQRQSCKSKGEVIVTFSEPKAAQQLLMALTPELGGAERLSGGCESRRPEVVCSMPLSNSTVRDHILSPRQTPKTPNKRTQQLLEERVLDFTNEFAPPTVERTNEILESAKSSTNELPSRTEFA